MRRERKWTHRASFVSWHGWSRTLVVVLNKTGTTHHLHWIEYTIQKPMTRVRQLKVDPPPPSPITPEAMKKKGLAKVPFKVYYSNFYRFAGSRKDNVWTGDM
jgi:hypothetical protein